MAVFEERWYSEPAGQDRFFCTHCERERDGRRSTARRYFLLFGRRILPLSGPWDFLTCQVCGRSYHARVADQSPEQARETSSEDERALESIAAAMIFSDSAVRHIEKTVAAAVIRRFTGRVLDEAEFDGLLRTARVRWGNPLERLDRLGTFTTDAARRRIIQAAYLVSGADRELHTQESRLIMKIGEALRMTPREVRAAIESARALEEEL